MDDNARGRAPGAGESRTGDARSVFLELVRRHPEAVDDAIRFAGLLADRYGGRWGREAAALGAAVRDGVPSALRRGSGPLAVLAARLARNRGIDPELARWAVEAWGAALGLSAERAAPPKPSAPGKPAVSAPGTLQVRTVPPGAELWIDARYAGTTPVVVPVPGAGTVTIEAVAPGGLRYRGERGLVPGTDDVLVIDLEAEAARRRVAQEQRGGRDFALFVLLAMAVSVIATVLTAFLGRSRSR